MNVRNGVQLAASCVNVTTSRNQRQFFQVFWAWSSIGVGHHGSRRGESAKQFHTTSALKLRTRAGRPGTTQELPSAEQHSPTPERSIEASSPLQQTAESLGRKPTPRTAPSPNSKPFVIRSRIAIGRYLKKIARRVQGYGQGEPPPQGRSLNVGQKNNPQLPSNEARNGASPGAQVSRPDVAIDTDIPFKLRTIMRGMPHAVVVLTTSEPWQPTISPSIGREGPKEWVWEWDGDEKRLRRNNPDWDERRIRLARPSYGWRAMTLSSFTTLALSPTPLITFNITTPSLTLSAFEKRRSFLIHILSPDVEGGGGIQAFENGIWQTAMVGMTPMAKKVLPMIKNPGVLMVLKCSLNVDHDPASRVFPQGSKMKSLIRVTDNNLIVVAAVKELIDLRGSGYTLEGGEEEDEVHGLGYADRKYRAMGSIIDINKRWGT
ncbi:hypothetical protein B0J14DRAFT_601771 [Halenospora varia]|nr:hypothetical protein B0J14DRAFT_601771 [Halenospora varia]